MSTVRPRIRRALSATAERVGHVIRQLTVERVRPWLRAFRTVHVARAAEPALAPLISWRGVGLADPPAGPEPPVAPLAGGVVPPGLVPPPVAGPMPVPLSAAVVVPAAVLSASVSVALRAPPAFGVNTRPTSQDSSAATGRGRAGLRVDREVGVAGERDAADDERSGARVLDDGVTTSLDVPTLWLPNAGTVTVVLTGL